MHDKFAIDEIKRVRFGLEWMSNHLLDRLGVQLWKVVNVLHCVLALRNAKAKVEIERFEKLVPEIMTLNHAKFLDGLVAYGKIHGGAHFLQSKKEKKNI